jgi:LCP family protein required for cell wall assembly
VVLITALLLAIGSYTGFRLFQLANAISPHAGLGDVVGLAQNQDDTPGTLAYKIHHGERVNILMLGYGGDGHDGAYLSDSIMLVSVEGVDRVSLTSLPRDTYVQVKAYADGSSYSGKVNAAYEIPLAHGSLGKPAAQYDTGFDGAGKLATKTIGEYLGVNIDYWVGIDFTAFKEVVDAIGGVDVNVPTALDDYEYPTDTGYGYQHIHFNPGTQHMDGSRALIYARERHADNDFGRSRRQQQLIAVIKEKIQKPSVISQMYQLMDALKDNVHTNMSLNDLKVFGGVVGKINGEGVHHVSIDATNWQYEATGYDGAYLLMPRDGTMASLHKFVQSEMVNPQVLAEKARLEVTSTPGQASHGDSLAGIFASSLHMLNFNAAAPGTSSAAPPTTVVHDYSGGRAARTAAWMAAYFGGTVVVEEPSGAPPAPDTSPSPGSTPPSAAVVVQLGRDAGAQFDASGPGNNGYTPSRYQPPSYYTRPYNSTPAPRRSAKPTSQPTQAPVAPTLAPTAPPTRKPVTCPPVCPTPAASPAGGSGGGGGGGGGGGSPG